MTFFLEICDAIFPLQKITMKTKKVEKILLGLQQGSENHQGRSSIYIKSFFKKKTTKRSEVYKQYKNLFGKTKKKG